MSSENPFEASDFVHAEVIYGVSEELKLLTFPDGFRCYSHTSVEETELIYNEIMIKQEYLGHGLSVDDAHFVFDVGANIGIFTLLAKSRNPNAAVFALEPIKETFDVLKLNVDLHCLSGVNTYNIAVCSLDRTEKTFAYYPNMAGNSTSTPGIKQTQREVMNRMFGKEQTDLYFKSEMRFAPIRTLSSLVEENGVTAIDYLKIDVEGDEMAVLEGLAEHLARWLGKSLWRSTARNCLAKSAHYFVAGDSECFLKLVYHLPWESQIYMRCGR